jgi:probable F420-dependent oxidoreductase
MQFGAAIFFTDYTMGPVELGRALEERGFESLWAPEHSHIPLSRQSPFPQGGDLPKKYYDVMDPFVTLAAAAAATSRLQVATGVCLVVQRDPIQTAKSVASLDQISKGRFLFGIGAGWLKEETELMGGDFEHRWTQTRESVLAMKELWTKAEAEFHGKYYDFPPVKSNPKPAQKPHPPVLLGGGAKNVLQRVVAWGDGWLPNRVTPDQLRESRATLDRLAKDAGRNPASLTISVHGQPADRELIKRLHDAGATRVIVRPNAVKTDAEMAAQLGQIAEAVL